MKYLSGRGIFAIVQPKPTRILVSNVRRLSITNNNSSDCQGDQMRVARNKRGEFRDSDAKFKSNFSGYSKRNRPLECRKNKRRARVRLFFSSPPSLPLSPLFFPLFPPGQRRLRPSFCAGAMLIFSVSFQF